MAKKRNIIVGQSGGPTAVINSSLAGVYKNAIERGFDKVYGMLHGIQGLLDEQYVDLSTQIHSELDIELLKRTPSAFLGSCRFKLPEIHEDKEIYEKIFVILNKLDIDTFIYIGGNDSMDTIKKLSDYAIITGQSQKFLGVPKTIDNDLALTDHTPGFGSAAKYIGASTKEVIRDAQGLTYKKNMITIMEIMGRNAGWLTGATALAKAEDLCRITGGKAVGLEKIEETVKNCRILIYAASQKIQAIENIDLKNKIIFEANYKDPALGNADCKLYIPGIKWLINQAIPSFEIFTGITPSLERMTSSPYFLRFITE